MPWPWTDLSPADLQPLEDAVAYSQVDLRPDQVAVVTDMLDGSASGIAIASPDGQAAWRFSVRPLLPDEAPLARRRTRFARSESVGHDVADPGRGRGDDAY